jgi:ABC-type transporter Mla subunit MlaD
LPKDADLNDLKKVFAADRQLTHLWAEYADSLHPQHANRDGRQVVVAIRSTLPAEAYFCAQYVVDTPLRTEFFKHLPGIFTGVGIIGTFWGLIQGLGPFALATTVTAQTMVGQLKPLIMAVRDAFVISALAIIAAMLVTFIEKMLLVSLYRLTEEIAHAIDKRFETGVTEEYLSQTAQNTKSAATQAAVLKDALVGDLKKLLENMVAYQVQASQAETKKLGQSITQGIEQSLQKPLSEIAAVVQQASGDQSKAASQMLGDVMAGFSQKLNDLFGGQISGIQQLNQQTTQGVAEAVKALNGLVARLEESSQRSTADMAQKTAAALQAMNVQQSGLQAQTQQKLQEILTAMGEQMTTVLKTLATSQASAFELGHQREQVMAARAQRAVTDMTGSVDTAVKEIAEASKIMAGSVDKLSAATTTSIDKMHAGAERLDAAATRFASAGDSVSQVMEKAAGVSAQLTQVSEALTSGSVSLGEVLRDYKEQRQAMVQLLGEMRSLVETVRREGSMTADALKRIEASAERLSEAHKAADAYLDGVSKVLGDSSAAFRESVTSTLGQVNGQFHAALSTAVNLLSGAVQELETALGSFNPKPKG